LCQVFNDEDKRLFNKIGKSLINAINFIDTILVTTQLGYKDIAFDICHFDDILEECIAVLEPKIQDTNSEITSSFNVETVKANKPLLMSVIINLLDNSIKYCPATRNPTVHLNTFNKSNKTILAVTDNGIGIPADKKQEIFDEFKQIEESSDGQGIGLSTVKSILHLHHAKINIESSDEFGTRFIIAFPND
jgi:signal transduction histidine kinase